MTAKPSIPAKITRPVLSEPVKRERLFSLLDEAAERPVTWISAPGGSGKSTLAASYLDARGLPCIWYQCDEGDGDLATFFYYMGLAARQAAPRFKKPLPLLTPEYLAGIPSFTRRYFELLFDRLLAQRASDKGHKSFVIVLDNYQNVPSESPFHEMIATGLDAIPDGVRFMVLSRSAPPPPLSRIQANGRIALTRYDEVRFTIDESMELMRSRIPDLERERASRIHLITQGWAAGIILLLEGRALGVDGGIQAAELDYERVFDYFAAEIFTRLEKETRDFLLKSALFPVMNVLLTERLTGNSRGGRLLAGLNRQHLFTERLSGNDENYQYHPLFREFLLSRIEMEYPSGELSRLWLEAAQMLERSGQWEGAARLFCRSGGYDGLAQMVYRHARELLIQGRSRVIGEWIACIPLERTGSDPWLLYWKGICNFPVDLPSTRSFLERAIPLFSAAGDAVGVCLSWAGMVDTHAFGGEWGRLDECIAGFDEIKGKFPCCPSSEVELIASSRMLLALTLRRTDDPELVEEWLRRVNDLLQHNPSFDIQMETIFCMSVYYLWKGEYERNSVLLERAAHEVRHRQPPPFTLIRIKLMKGIHAWITADYREALQTLSEGLEVSSKSGVHIYDSLLWSFRAAADMAPGNLEDADASLRHQMSSMIGMETALNLFFYHVNSAWHALLTGRSSLAAEHMDTVSAAVDQMGTPYYRALWHIGMAQIAFALGRCEEAFDLARRAREISLAMKSQVMEWYSLLIDAWFLLEGGKETEGLLALHRGLSLGRRHGFVHLEFYQPTVMRSLFARALAEDMEPDYVKGLVRKLSLTPPVTERDRFFYTEPWPFPVRIYTLGRFEILINDEPLLFAGKEQKKPLEMLKALISRGGRDVPSERITDILWPDADGDLAQKSFETTLARLRKLLGGDDRVTCRSRQLSINPLRCWVDCLALLHLFDTIRDVQSAQAALLCKKALELYKGVFLPGEADLPWSVARREILRNGLLRISLKAGRYHEESGGWEQAAFFYSKGIETDNLAEEFHRRLMICQRKLGNLSDAIRTYQRCRTLLRAEFGIEPSPETSAVYNAITQQS
jgi:LuxR family maltose regulon positive regulatory protein